MNKLQALYLNGNSLRALPVGIGQLTSLRMLFLQVNVDYWCRARLVVVPTH
jgi:Leucine-rich repeat (LRR) protein